MATAIPTNLMQSKKRTGKKFGFNSKDHWIIDPSDKPAERDQVGRLMNAERKKEQGSVRISKDITSLED